jgi:LacI family transcriptional regulator
MQSALLASKLDFKYIWPVTNIAENNSNLMHDILADLIKKKEMPTAILCITDSLASSLLWTLNDLGISVPNMVSITGYDSDPNEVFDSPITSIGMDKLGIGINTFSLLLSRIQNRNSLYKRLNIVPQLLIRKTAGPVNPN